MTAADVYFAVVPEWLIWNAPPRALQVYCILRRHADYTQGDAETFISRRKMAAIAKCHTDTIDRALADLVALSAIEVKPRYEKGRQTSNLYTVRTVPGGVRTDAEGEGRIDTEGEGGINQEGKTDSQMTDSHSTDLAVPGRKELHDAMAWALVDVMGWDRNEVPDTQWGRVHKAAKELVDVGADPEDVPRRVAVYRAQYPTAAVTPTAIASNWPALRELDVPVSKRDVARAATRERTRRHIEQIGDDADAS